MSAVRSAGASLMPSPMKPTTWPFAFRSAHDALLVGRRQLGEDVVRLDRVRQLRVVHALHVRAEQHAVRLQARPRRQIFAVTSSLSPVSTLTATPCVGERLQRRRGGFLRRIEEGDVADQGQIALVGDAVVCLDWRQLLDRDGHDAQAVLVERGRDLADAREQLVGQRLVESRRDAPGCRRGASPRPRPCRSADGARRARPPPPTCAGAGSRTGSRRPCRNAVATSSSSCTSACSSTATSSRFFRPVW